MSLRCENWSGFRLGREVNNLKVGARATRTGRRAVEAGGTRTGCLTVGAGGTRTGLTKFIYSPGRAIEHPFFIRARVAPCATKLLLVSE